MSVEPIAQNSGVSRAKVICDDCGRDETVACTYSRNGSKKSQPNEAQARTKMIGLGWSYVKGKLRCPACEAKRKTEPEGKPMKSASVTELRQPTPRQKREIIGLLEEVYDDENKRYKGGETDKTVAEAIGGGVMPGWVAEIRGEMFGPDGGNEEIAALMLEMREWKAAREKEIRNARIHLESAEGAIREMEASIAKVAEFEKRQVAIVRAVGPKAGSA